MKTIKVKTSEEVPTNFTGIIEWSTGTKWWYKNGRFHRENGPAVVSEITQRQEWWQNGLMHRLDGPAIESYYGKDEYAILGLPLSEEQFATFIVLWEQTPFEQTNKLMWIFVKVAKMTRKQFMIFEYLWGHTLLERTEELMEMFVELVKMK